MRCAIDQREKSLIKEVEKLFTLKMGVIEKMSSELSEAIEEGEKVLESYKAMSLEIKGKDVASLKKLLSLKKAINKTKFATSGRCQTRNIVHVATEVSFQERDELIKRINDIGKITETTNLPAPHNFRGTQSGHNSIYLAWDAATTGLPVTYSIMSKMNNDTEDKWSECYNDSKTKITLKNFKTNTAYSFKIFTIYNGAKSTNCATCLVETVNST